MNNNGNRCTVHVVQNDGKKDFSDARRYGQLRAVFSNPRRPYETANLLRVARERLQAWRPGDYLLMVGDPVLCAVCVGLLVEHHADQLKLLSWDRLEFRYEEQVWDFTPEPFSNPAGDRLLQP